MERKGAEQGNGRYAAQPLWALPHDFAAACRRSTRKNRRAAVRCGDTAWVADAAGRSDWPQERRQPSAEACRSGTCLIATLICCHLTSLPGRPTTAGGALRSPSRQGRLERPVAKREAQRRGGRPSPVVRKCNLCRNLRSRRLLLLLALTLAMFTQTIETLKASPAVSRVSEFKLANGMQVVVVPDHRAPVVTHYVWYRVGSADEPPGVSGIAHFLEHLMFKSTDKIAPATSPRSSPALGGQDNAFTSHDVTGYYQRIAKDRLEDRDGDGSRPHDEPEAHREGSGDRARGDHRGAPLAHGEQPFEHPLRADVGRALSEPSLSHPHHRLDARDGQALARGRARLLQALLRPQQCHRRRRRRRHRRGSEGAGGGGLRRARSPTPTSRCASGRRSRRTAPHAAWSSGTRARATPRCGASTWRPASPRPRPARPRRSTC